MEPFLSELPYHIYDWLIISLKDFCIVIRKWPTFLPSSIKDEQSLYDNSAGTTTLFEARTGTLQLNDTKRHTNGETSCELCGYHYENCEHFLLHCTALQETRKNVIGLQQPFKESIDETISDFLLFKENSEEIINRMI